MTSLAESRYGKRLGERIGHLTFLRLSANTGDNNRILGIFRCDCGIEVERSTGRVLSGRGSSHCGCMTDRGTHRTHGMRGSPEYAAWLSMKDRCLNPQSKDFPKWGGRGVTVWPAWIGSFEEFYSHVGPRPSGMTLDRIDTQGNYEPGNVRWATRSQQQRNRTTAYVWHIQGKRFETHTEAAVHFGVSEHTIWRWVNGQADRRRGTFTPPKGNCYVELRY